MTRRQKSNLLTSGLVVAHAAWNSSSTGCMQSSKIQMRFLSAIAIICFLAGGCASVSSVDEVECISKDKIDVGEFKADFFKVIDDYDEALKVNAWLQKEYNKINASIQVEVVDPEQQMNVLLMHLMNEVVQKKKDALNKQRMLQGLPRGSGPSI